MSIRPFAGKLRRDGSSESLDTPQKVLKPPPEVAVGRRSSASVAPMPTPQTKRKLVSALAPEDPAESETAHKMMLLKIGASFQNERVADVARRSKVSGRDAKWILDPDSKPKRRWTLFVYVLVMYSALWLPFSIAFQPNTSAASLILDYFVDFLFFIDVLVNMRSAFLEDGV